MTIIDTTSLELTRVITSAGSVYDFAFPDPQDGSDCDFVRRGDGEWERCVIESGELADGSKLVYHDGNGLYTHTARILRVEHPATLDDLDSINR